MSARVLPPILAPARAGLRASVLLVALIGLSGCSQDKPTEVPGMTVHDTLGPMPCMVDRRMLPNLDDPKVKEIFDLTIEVGHACKALNKKDQHEEAAAMAREAIKRAEATLGPDSCLTADLYYDLAASVSHLGPTPEAERALRNVLRVRAAYLGDGCIDTARSVYALCSYLLETGRSDEAMQLYNQHWESAQKQPASLSSKVAYMHTLAVLRMNRGEYEPAFQLEKQALDMKLLVPTLRQTEPTQYILAATACETAARVNRFEEATEIADKFCQFRYGLARPYDPQVASVLASCADHWAAVNDRKRLGVCVEDLNLLLQSRFVKNGMRLQLQSLLPRYAGQYDPVVR